MSSPNLVKEAANTVPGTECSPLDGFIENRVEQLIRQYKHLIDPDLKVVELVYAAYECGMQDANSRVGDLF